LKKLGTSRELGIRHGSIAGMYKDYLKSDHWIEFKNRVHADKPYGCYICRKFVNLEVHHITYKNLGNEDIDDVVYLCHKCHLYATNSSEKDKLQKWLERMRKRNMIKRKKFWGKKTYKQMLSDKKKRRAWRKYF
jgi:hypothetical protein